MLNPFSAKAEQRHPSALAPLITPLLGEEGDTHGHGWWETRFSSGGPQTPAAPSSASLHPALAVLQDPVLHPCAALTGTHRAGPRWVRRETRGHGGTLFKVTFSTHLPLEGLKQ